MNRVTISWVDYGANLAELDVPEGVVEEIARGGPVAWRGESRPRRTPNEQAQAKLRADLRWLEERHDEMVSEFPQLKANRRPPGG